MNKSTKEPLGALERLGCRPRRTVVDFFGRKYTEWIAQCPAHPNGTHAIRIMDNSDGGYTFYPDPDGHGHCSLDEIVSQLHQILPKHFPKPQLDNKPTS